jgi:hypothetical protein
MEPLEQVTILMTLMHRLEQVMDMERGILGAMRLDSLPDIQEEKEALAEAYEIELARLRRQPERVGDLDQGIREQLEDAMRQFQERMTANMEALRAAHHVVEKVLKTIAESVARSPVGPGYQGTGQVVGTPSGARIIPLALDRQL